MRLDWDAGNAEIRVVEGWPVNLATSENGPFLQTTNKLIETQTHQKQAIREQGRVIQGTSSLANRRPLSLRKSIVQLQTEATMKINRDNLKWAARLMAIIVLVAVADGLVVTLMRRPFPWTVLIPGSAPILIAFFVILPMAKADRG